MFINWRLKKLINNSNLFSDTEKALFMKTFNRLSNEQKEEIYKIILDYIDSQKSISLQYIQDFREDLNTIKGKAKEKGDLAPEGVADDMQKGPDLIEKEIKKK